MPVGKLDIEGITSRHRRGRAEGQACRVAHKRKAAIEHLVIAEGIDELRERKNSLFARLDKGAERAPGAIEAFAGAFATALEPRANGRTRTPRARASKSDALA